jgi:hypothetical protein
LGQRFDGRFGCGIVSNDTICTVRRTQNRLSTSFGYVGGVSKVQWIYFNEVEIWRRLP